MFCHGDRKYSHRQNAYRYLTCAAFRTTPRQILATLPESRDLANSMRLLRSICKVGHSLLPSIQRLVAVTVLVGVDTAAAAAAGRAAGGGSEFGSGRALGSGGGGGGGSGRKDSDEGDGDGEHGVSAAASQGRDGGGGGDDEASRRVGSDSLEGEENHLLRNPRSLFRYELIRDMDVTTSDVDASGAAASGTGSDRGNGSGGALAFGASASRPSLTPSASESGRGKASSNSSSIKSQRRRPSLRGASGTNFRSADGTNGIRVRLKRLVAGVSMGEQLRRRRELLNGETRVSSGEGVIFEAVQEGSGSASRTVVRVLSRCVSPHSACDLHAENLVPTRVGFCCKRHAFPVAGT